MYSMHANADKSIAELLADEIQDDLKLGAYPLHAIFSALAEYAKQSGMTDDAEIFAAYAQGWKL